MSSMKVCREGQQGPGKDHSTVCFSVSADADPSVMGRIFGLFAKRGLVPDRWHSQVSSDGELQIDVQMIGVNSADAEQYAQAMRQIFCVDRVLMSFKLAVEDAPA